MKTSKLSEEKYKMYNLRKRGASRSGIELSPVLREIKRFQKSRYNME